MAAAIRATEISPGTVGRDHWCWIARQEAWAVRSYVMTSLQLAASFAQLAE
jgi:hypothetical protein